MQAVGVGKEGKKRATENLEIKPGDGQNEEQVHHCCDSDSPSNSPSSHVSSSSGSNVSGTNFTASSSGSSSSSWSCSGSVTGEDEDADDDGCLDDWEAMADALATSDDKQEEDKPKPELPDENQTRESTNRAVELPNQVVELPKPKLEHVEKVQRAPPSGRAWKPDDASRPQSLPNLAKQNSFPSGRNYGCGSSVVWARKIVVSAPTSCPICCEDLDYTDSSFYPCSCGFRLCLFCHKRILEEDGRCPGCRKPYEYEPVKGEAAFRLARSCSMITRS